MSIETTDLQHEFPADEGDFVTLGEAMTVADKVRRLEAVAERLARGVGDGKPRLTDSGNAERWVSLHGSRFRFHAARGCWFRWNGTVWAEDVEGEAHLATKEVARDYLVDATQLVPRDALELVKWAAKSESAGARSAMLKLAASEPGMSVGANAWDSDPMSLNVDNGVLDLRTGELRPHSSADLFTKLAPTRYVADAEAPRFMRFLEEALPDPELRDFLQRLCGYALTGEVREHVLPIFYGSGGNGKGTLVETLSAVLGDYARAVPAELLMKRVGQSEAHPTERAQLMGLRLAFASETEAGRALAESTVKMLTGGDSISARFMRQDFFEFSPSHKLILSTNHKPVIKGTDRGIWRRVRLVPWDVVPQSPDPTLKHKLLAEREGILAWCVAGCLRWQAEGLGSAGAIDLATAEYRDESDVLGSFLAERTIAVGDAWTRSSDLYTAYRRWAEAQGESPWTQKSFTRALGERGLKPVRKNIGMVFVGLGMLADGAPSVGSDPAFPVERAERFPRGVNPEIPARPYTLHGPSQPTIPGTTPSSSDEDDEFL